MSKSKKISKDIRRHFIFVEVPVSIVGFAAISWERSVWWPEKCMFKFIREDEADTAVGDKFTQKISIPFFPALKGEVAKFIPDKEIERHYTSALFKAKENISIEGRMNGTRVDYHLEVELSGFLARLVWNLILSRRYDKNIKKILSSLKKYVIETSGDNTI